MADFANDNIRTDEKREAQLRRYVWREKSDRSGGNVVERPLIDYDKDSLQKFYNVCNEMLYNRDPINQGRYQVLSEIEEQRKNCNIALFVKYIIKQYKKTEFLLYDILRQFVENNKAEHPNILKYKMSDVIMGGGCPLDFKDITIDEVMRACRDSIGIFCSKHITKRLILEQGICLTDSERKELTPSVAEYEEILERFRNGEKILIREDKNGKNRIGKLEIIRLRLGLKPDMVIFTKKDGLTYTQFRAMIQLPGKAKYSELTKDQLKTLRDRILPILEIEVRKHITQWRKRMERIVEVAEYKGYQLDTSTGQTRVQ